MSDVETILLGFVVISGLYAILGFVITRKYIDNTLTNIASIFQDMFANPTVKGAMTILGKQSGEARADKAVVDSLATDMLDSPQMSAIQMGADALGVDLKGYIDKHGAVQTLQGLSQIAGMLGIDVTQLIAGNGGALGGGALSLPGGSGKHPYLGGK